MAKRSSGKKKTQSRRVAFRRNRLKPARQKNWSVPTDQNPEDEDTIGQESVRTKGALSRNRTVTDRTGAESTDAGRQIRGKVIAVRGRFVEIDDGNRIWPCTVRRILRTQLIRERHPVVVGDEVSFAIISESEGVHNEGVIEQVHPRHSALHRCDGRRTHVIASNVDQVLLVFSIREPMLKPHLIDRYLVAAHAGNITALICVNKVDLADEGEADEILERYNDLGYQTLATSAESGQGIEQLQSVVKDRVTLLAGQSGVGKSSLINAIQPGLNLRTAHVSTMTDKGRHTTTTAAWYKLDMGGAIVDTPGIRALDVAMVPINELEMHFIEFVDRLANCKYSNCIHIHENDCAIIAAVEAGEIDPSRYESYVQLFMERSEGKP